MRISDMRSDVCTSVLKGNDRWVSARDAGTAGAAEGTQTPDSAGNVVSSREARIDPYYLFTRPPDAEELEFLLMRPFVPFSDDDRSQLLTAFMVGKSDGEDYGKLQVYEIPPGDFPRGPALVQGDIHRDPDISDLETLLGRPSPASPVDPGRLPP